MKKGKATNGKKSALGSKKNSITINAETLEQTSKAISKLLDTSTVTKISQVKITKDNTLDISFTESMPDGMMNEIIKKGGGIVHPDLTKAMSALAPHVAIMCDQQDYPHPDNDLSKEDPEDFKQYIIHAVKLKGSGENASVSITASKLIETRTLELVTPSYSFSDMDYTPISELSQAIERILYEARGYLAGKYTAKQLDIFEEDEQKEEQPAEEAAA